jgi:hypothetical protein
MQVANLATRVEVAKALTQRVIDIASRGEVPNIEAAMFKLWTTTIGQAVSEVFMELNGAQGTLKRDQSARRWTGCSNTPSATRWSTRSAPAPPRCSATSSPGVAWACPSTTVSRADAGPHRSAQPGRGVEVKRPLAGVTVLDLTTVGPGARCAAMLADLGATIVRVGPPASANRIVPEAWAYSGGRGVRRIGIDLKDPRGRDACLALAAGADVVLEGFRPGVAERLGIGPDDVAATNPSSSTPG